MSEMINQLLIKKTLKSFKIQRRVQVRITKFRSSMHQRLEKAVRKGNLMKLYWKNHLIIVNEIFV
jgi:hypothetical protein